jgi:hypothetical protein
MWLRGGYVAQPPKSEIGLWPLANHRLSGVEKNRDLTTESLLLLLLLLTFLVLLFVFNTVDTVPNRSLINQ